MTDTNYDWKRLKRSGNWEYMGDIEDPRYMKERTEYFEKSGNGWWIYAGHPSKRLPRWWKVKKEQ
jgi:hypothetical protein